MPNEDGLEWLAGLQIVGNGRWWSSLTGKGIPEEAGEGTTKFLRIDIDPAKPVFPAPVRIGATINLGNFESARIEVGVEPIGDILKVEETYEWAERWAGEILNREVAVVKGVDRADKPLPVVPSHINHLVLGIQYGLTLNLGDYNSRKIDYGYYVPTMPQIAEEAWTEMSAFVGGRIQEKAKKLRGGPTPMSAGVKKKLPSGGMGI